MFISTHFEGKENRKPADCKTLNLIFNPKYPIDYDFELAKLCFASFSKIYIDDFQKGLRVFI